MLNVQLASQRVVTEMVNERLRWVLLDVRAPDGQRHAIPATLNIQLQLLKIDRAGYVQVRNSPFALHFDDLGDNRDTC